jgi:hypothetical protein
MCHLRPFAEIERQNKERAQANEAGDCSGGESAWLRLQTWCDSAQHPMEILYGSRMFIDRNPHHHQGLAPPSAQAAHPFVSSADGFQVEFEAESP